MAVTYEPIATTTTTTNQASITFSSIPGTYTDLVLIVDHVGTSNNNQLRVSTNTGGSGLYSRTILSGNGTTASSARYSNEDESFISYANSGSQRTVSIIHIMNYANTTTFKTLLSRSSNATEVRAQASLIRATGAITSVTCSHYNDLFASGSIFTLYGIKAA